MTDAAELTLTTTRGADAVVVAAAGEIDSSNGGRLQDLIGELGDEGRFPDVHVDLAQVSFIDSSGLRALLLSQSAVTAGGGTLRVVEMSDSVRRLLEITGLTERFCQPV